jgi:hypothetical protein
MKNRNIHYRTTIQTLLLALALAGLSCLTARADGGERTEGGAIVGLWHVTYFHSSGTKAFESYDQWHSDGQEFEVANLGAGWVCQGTWTQRGHTDVRLFHVGWLVDTPDGTSEVYGRFEETQTNKVSRDGNSYTGKWNETYYDLDGNVIGQNGGTLQATRISVY